jgi:hypothetical protein
VESVQRALGLDREDAEQTQKLGRATFEERQIGRSLKEEKSRIDIPASLLE